MWSDATWYDVICLIWCSDYCCNVIALILIDIWWYSFDDVMWRLYIFIWCDLCTCWCDVMWLVFIWTDFFSSVERCYTCVLYWYDMCFFFLIWWEIMWFALKCMEYYINWRDWFLFCINWDDMTSRRYNPYSGILRRNYWLYRALQVVSLKPWH